MKSQSLWNLRRRAQAPSDRIHTIMEEPFRDPLSMKPLPSSPVVEQERPELPMQGTKKKKERRLKFGTKE
jgi:hypothetical protein